MHSLFTTRRTAMLLLGASAMLPWSAPAVERPPVQVHKDANCSCCNGWIAHLRNAGFPVTGVDTPRLIAVKARLGVPTELQSCHTAEVGGYVVEGHVPATAVERLLADRPRARGISVPGMPIGSPGMEGGEPETYEVILFGPEGQRVFARYRGTHAI